MRQDWMSERFYQTSIKPEIDKKGESYMEWVTIKSEVIRQANYLRTRHKLLVTWFEKYEGCYVFCCKLNSEQEAKECDASKAEQGTNVDNQKKQS